MTRLVLILLFTLATVPGCAFNTHGNRRPDQPIVTRYAELHGHVGRQVTLVGTARATGAQPDAVTLDLRGGTVVIPAYTWPAEYVDQPVTISGTLFERGSRNAYQLGEIGEAAKWSR